ncbi:TfuA-like protein [Streptomyces sp. NPDC057253]|uniref:TfuA-like protein n=1 Tax=Streptomyces sp. NPDC057253 TaxID=3346069 RepID=UPI00363304EA
MEITMHHVFVGPTLSRSEPELTAPSVRVWPPVQHGDLFSDAIGEGDTVVIIDGVYHQAPALRHKEILAAMGRGVRVIGAASIGALRAAELAPFGMLGVGSIYGAYMNGSIDGDDEVAVGQAPAGGWRALTWPVVNLRLALELARRAGVCDGGRAAVLLEALRAVYYPQRTTAAVRAVCRRHGDAAFAEWLSEQRARDEHFANLKRTDALAAVRTALDDQSTPAVCVQQQMWETAYFRRWSNSFARSHVDGLDLATADRLIYQQVFDQEFPRTWTAYLQHCSLRTTGSEPGRPLAMRLAHVTSSDLPAHSLFRPPVDLRNKVTVALLLARETPDDRLAVARFGEALRQAQRSRPGFCIDAVRGDLSRRMLLEAWGCPAERLDAEASARGLICGARAIEATKRLVPGYLNESSSHTNKEIGDER